MEKPTSEFEIRAIDLWLREWSELLEVFDSEGAIAVEDVQAAASGPPS